MKRTGRLHPASRRERLLDARVIARSDPTEGTFLRNELSPEHETGTPLVPSLASEPRNYETNCHQCRGPPRTGEAFPVVRSRKLGSVLENISDE
jgi:hypothetical protein